MMIRSIVVMLAVLLGAPSDANEVIRHFPSIVFGQILLGPGASRYEITFSVQSRREVPVTMELFSDEGEPMVASLVDSEGVVAATDSSFRFIISGGQPLKLRLQPAPDELKEDVVLKTGWANFRSSEELDVSALVRILTPGGKLLNRHLLLSERLSHS